MTDFKLGIVRLGRVAGKVSGAGAGARGRGRGSGGAGPGGRRRRRVSAGQDGAGGRGQRGALPRRPACVSVPGRPQWSFAQGSRRPRWPGLDGPRWASQSRASLCFSPLPGPALRVVEAGASWHLWALRLGCFQEPAGRAAAPATDLTLDGNPVPITSGGSFWWERGAEAVR